MKKIVYLITIVCLMFLCSVEVNALGSIKVDAKYIEVKKGETATFKIIVENALARANISSSNKKAVTVNEAGLWVSAGEGKNKTIEHIITVNGVGRVGSTSKVVVDVFDATSYDGDELATDDDKLTYTVKVKVVDENGKDNSMIFIIVGSIIIVGGAFCGWYFIKHKKNASKLKK